MWSKLVLSANFGGEIKKKGNVIGVGRCYKRTLPLTLSKILQLSFVRNTPRNIDQVYHCIGLYLHEYFRIKMRYIISYN